MHSMICVQTSNYSPNGIWPFLISALSPLHIEAPLADSHVFASVLHSSDYAGACNVTRKLWLCNTGGMLLTTLYRPTTTVPVI
jgi:hypothetical protein